MSIQSNINQTISLLGLLASQSPLAEKQKVKAREAEERKKTQEQINKYEQMAEQGKEPETPAEAEAQLSIARVGEEAYSRAFAQTPTEKTYQGMLGQKRDVAELSQTKADLQKKKAEDALRAEQARLNEDRIRHSILEGVYSTDKAYDPRFQKQGGAN